MAIKKFRPLTPSMRYMTVVKDETLSDSRPQRGLVYTKKRSGGRNSHGRVTARGIGGGAKKKVRIVDFRRIRHGQEAKVVSLEYDPSRTANVALVQYPDGKKTYIVATNGLTVGSVVSSGADAKPSPGNCLPLSRIPVGQVIHNVELHPGRGAQIARSAGVGATLMARSEGYAQVKLPSGEIRKISEKCSATIGVVGNSEHQKVVLGKAGRNRHLGRRPITRAVAKNPVDHPMGGGAGKTSGGGHPVTPWGVLTKGFKTRKRRKYSDKMIVQRRDGRPFKRK